MKRILLVKILSMAFLSVSAAFCFAEDAEIKLNSNNGSTKLVVQNSNAVTVFSADSAGNVVVAGTIPVFGARFSVGGSTFVVRDGNIGIGTPNPAAALEVAGQVKIIGGAPGAGKVLKSDAAGLASWQTPVVVSSFSIGDSYGGGKIFWLDASGKHGLIAATADQSAGIAWYTGSSFTTWASTDAVYAGRGNTSHIVSTQGAGSYAAKLCADYAVTVNNEYYDDWYLPSAYELNLLYAQKALIGGFASGYYWSSSEFVSNTTNAWTVNFNIGGLYIYDKTTSVYVRCVRAGP